MNASQYDINKLFGLQTVKSEPSIPPAANTDTPISKVEALMHYESLKAKLDDIKLEMDKMKSIIVDGFILKSGTNKVKIGERQIWDKS
jgi:hypothetical protein